MLRLLALKFLNPNRRLFDAITRLSRLLARLFPNHILLALNVSYTDVDASLTGSRRVSLRLHQDELRRRRMLVLLLVMDECNSFAATLNFVLQVPSYGSFIIRSGPWILMILLSREGSMHGAKLIYFMTAADHVVDGIRA